ncbi:OmpA family protein [Hymenobacter cavernae]|nr:OmpA family protein [Hymenobacter cavernae]
MKFLLTLVLTLCWLRLCAQEPSEQQLYTDAKAGWKLTYPRGWQFQRREDSPEKTETTFYVGPTRAAAPAEATLIVRPLPENQKDRNLLAFGQLDSVWQAIRALPQPHVLRLEQRDLGRYQELDYEYTYTPKPGSAERFRVVGRRVWRGGYAYRLEYRAALSQDRRYQNLGQQLVESFGFTRSAALPSRRYDEQICDDKMYGIAALRVHDGIWEDDCRSIHQFSVSNPSASPKIHDRVLPFQSYALAKGFDNCLYSVTKSPTNAPEYVYRYNPATRQGEYTPWRLPAQGGESVWISAATDEHGDLYFITSNGGKLVKVSPADGSVSVVWATDPVRQAPYYSSIAFAGAGTHANFCLDDTNTIYQVYSTDGSLLKVDLATRQPAPEMLKLEGLPQRGGYSDVLLQKDAAGRQLYLAGPKALYRVNLDKHQAYQVRRGIYTDLAGCSLFAVRTRQEAPPRLPATATWRGRVLDAATLQPLARAQLRLRAGGGSATAVPLAPDGSFAFPTKSNQAYTAQVQFAGYWSSDTTYTTGFGPYVQDVLLRPLTVGATLSLENVHFEQGETVLLSSSLPALNQLVTLLKNTPGLAIELRGHTDNVGDSRKNLLLSQRRSAAVKAYLVSHGVAAARVTNIGLGGAEPRASNQRETTRRLNRRVDFRVVRVK